MGGAAGSGGSGADVAACVTQASGAHVASEACQTCVKTTCGVPYGKLCPNWYDACSKGPCKDWTCFCHCLLDPADACAMAAATLYTCTVSQCAMECQ